MLKKSLVIKIFICLGVIFVGGIGLNIFISHKKNSEALVQKELKEFSNDRYTIYFTKAGRGPNGDGSVFEVFSIKSDGSDLKFVKNEDSKIWSEKVYGSASGIFESMGNYVGHFESPDKQKKIDVESTFFTTPKIYVEQNGKRVFLRKEGFGEMKWLPDSKRIIYSTDDKMYLIDILTKQIGYVGEGIGYFMFEESK